MGIVVNWNRDYSTYATGYKVYSGADKDSCTTLLSTIADLTTTSYYDTSGDDCKWYKIATTFVNGVDTWDSPNASCQYFTKSVIPKIRVYPYQQVVSTSNAIDVFVAANIASGTVNIGVSGITGTTACTLNSHGFGNATLPAIATSGTYDITVDNGLTCSDKIIVSNMASSLVSRLENDILYEFQNIHVHNEAVAESNMGGTIFKFAFGNWNKNIDPIFINGDNSINTVNAYIDYVDGVVGIPGVQVNNNIMGNYTFRYFTQATLYDFVKQATNELNLIKPFTTYTIDSMPDQWDQLVLLGAYRWALRMILQGLLFKDFRLIMDKDAIGIIQGLLTESSTDWTNARKDAKRRGMVQPGVVVSGKYRTPIRVTGMNWQQYVGIVT